MVLTYIPSTDYGQNSEICFTMGNDLTDSWMVRGKITLFGTGQETESIHPKVPTTSNLKKRSANSRL
jgi:hypothetical protein